MPPRDPLAAPRSPHSPVQPQPQPQPRAARLALVASAAALLTVVTGCSGSADAPAATTDAADADGHGAIAGATEMPEPQPHLVTIDSTGTVSALDLLDESTTAIGRIDDVTSVTTDGRFVFAASAPAGTVTVVDSGVWTWDHEDHFHYYRSEPRLVGVVEGEGEAVVSTGSAATGVFFPASGEAVVLDRQALADDEIVETLAVDAEPHDGSITPLGEGALLTVTDGTGAVRGVQELDADGAPVGAEQPCPGARGAASTSVGVALVCDDGALLATEGGAENSGGGSSEDSAGGSTFEHLPYPSDATAPTGTATDAFANRRGRPVVAAAAGDAGFWALDTRSRAWAFVATETPLLTASAVDDREGHVVAVTADGRILVASADTGETLSLSEPLLAPSLADPDLAGGVALSVDRGRAYVNAPADGVVFEIDFADGARVSRTFDVPQTPLFAVETGV